MNYSYLYSYFLWHCCFSQPCGRRPKKLNEGGDFCFVLFCCVLKEADQLLIISSQDEFAVKDYGNSRVKTSTVLSIP